MIVLRLLLMVFGLVLLATPAGAQTRTSANVPAKLSVLRPLTLVGEQELNFGTVILGPGTWSNASISVSASGVRTCAAAVSCTGATTAARFRLSGSNNQVVVISAPAVTLVNAADSAQRLTMTAIAPSTLRLTNSGNPGTLFSVGGTISVSSTTPDGVYSGTLEVTVEYQ